MINESALLESKSLRNSVLDRTDVLDRVKALSLLPDGMHVTTAMVAAYFEVGIKAIESLVLDHRQELEASGYRVLSGAELTSFKEVSGIQSHSRALALYPRRAVLNVAMLLRDSEVARQARVYLLDMEYLARTQPVDNSVHTAPDPLDDRIDQRIAHILGKTVVPMFNALIETSGEHRKELIALRSGVQRIERRLHQHHARLQRLEGVRDDRPAVGVMAAMDAMHGNTFERHIAKLLIRDGCTTSSSRVVATTGASTSSGSRPTGGASSSSARGSRPTTPSAVPRCRSSSGPPRSCAARKWHSTWRRAPSPLRP